MSPQLLSGAARLAGSSLLRLQSDERLVALVRDGHDPAFTAVVERYRGELSRYANRLVGESRAEDVVQQAFVNAHGAMTSSDSDLQLRPWLYRIVHNAALNALRATRRTDELDERLAAGATVEHSVETRERLQEALAAIALLPEPQRDALVLQAVEGRSHEEIAAALGVTAGAARQHVHRARGMVRAAVSAITPYGLLARFAMAGGGEPATTIAVSGAGAAGVGATVAKIGAGVLAAGAIATGTVGHVPLIGGENKHHDARPAAVHAQRPAAAAATALAASSPTAAAEPIDDRSPGPDDNSASGHGKGTSSGRHGRHHGGSGDDNGRSGNGSGADDSSGGGSDRQGRSGSSEDGGRSGSGDRSGSDDDGGGKRSGSGDDGGRSGSGSGSGSGSSDDGRTGSGSGSSSGSDAGGTLLSSGSGSGSESGSSGDGSGSGDSGSGSDDGGTFLSSGSGSGDSGSGSDDRSSGGSTSGGSSLVSGSDGGSGSGSGDGSGSDG